jgi:hypothetical protein
MRSFVISALLSIIRIIKSKRMKFDKACSMKRGEGNDYILLEGSGMERDLLHVQNLC